MTQTTTQLSDCSPLYRLQTASDIVCVGHVVVATPSLHHQSTTSHHHCLHRMTYHLVTHSDHTHRDKTPPIRQCYFAAKYDTIWGKLIRQREHCNHCEAMLMKTTRTSATRTFHSHIYSHSFCYLHLSVISSDISAVISASRPYQCDAHSCTAVSPHVCNSLSLYLRQNKQFN